MKSNLQHRILLSTMVVLCFGLTIGGILISMHSEASVDSEWKELLLLLLGALIGNFGKVIDYWFNKDT